MVAQATLYKVERSDAFLIEPLDAITLIYHCRSGVTHLVAEPVPEILSVMGLDTVDAATVLARLAASFDLGNANDAVLAVAARLEELADLGLVERVCRGA